MNAELGFRTREVWLLTLRLIPNDNFDTNNSSSVRAMLLDVVNNTGTINQLMDIVIPADHWVKSKKNGEKLKINIRSSRSEICGPRR